MTAQTIDSGSAAHRSNASAGSFVGRGSLSMTLLGFATSVSLLFIVLAQHPNISGIARVGRDRDSAVLSVPVATGAGTSSLRPATIVRTVSCEKLPDTPGKSITTAVVDFPPGA